MPDRKQLQQLLVRVEGAGGEDEALDDAISSEFQVGLFEVGPDDIARAARYTSSIDAAIALVERLLPGWHWQIGTMTRGGVVNVQFAQPVNTIYGPAIGRRADVTAKTPPLAILAALLTALMQTQDENV